MSAVELSAVASAAEAVERAAGARPTTLTPLTGGCVADVRVAALPDGRRVVVKFDPTGAAGLDIEARSLILLAEVGRLPAPRVLAFGPNALVMAFVDAGDAIDDDAQRHAAELLARLHATAPAGQPQRFGLDFDVRIGGLAQPNAWLDDWPAFFAERRLRIMAEQASQAGRLPASLRRRVEALADRLPEMLDNPPRASLVHGDVWSGNVLCKSGRIAAFLDPAPHFAHPEVELAFITLFNTFGEAFFSAYSERRPIAPGFFETRRRIYNVYPLLVHVRLFGGGYVGQLDATLRTVGR